MIKYLIIFIIHLKYYSPFQIYTFQNHVQIWKKYLNQTSKLKLWDLSTHLNLNDLCSNTSCTYPIYQYYNLSPNQTSPILFLVANFHGNQKLGSHIITEAFPFLKHAKHIILFPIANPSGYIQNMRQQFPSGIDPNRDFPYDQQPYNCMKGTISKIIDLIFRKWKIDITITIHAGGQQFSWNWGTSRHLKDITEDNDISYDIGKSLQLYGGKNSAIGMNQLKIGTMNQIIYSASGTFQDWAYAASWDVNGTVKCQYQRQPYPENMTNGLVFIFESGPFDNFLSFLGSQDGVYIKPNSSSYSNGYITRGIRMLIKLVEIIYPELIFERHENNLIIKSVGCNQTRIQLFINNNFYNKSIYGSMNIDPSPIYLQYSLISSNNQDFLQIQYKMICQLEWVGKGKTLFSKPRIYSGIKNIKFTELPIYKPQTYNVSKYSNYTFTQYAVFSLLFFFIIGIIILIIFAARYQHKKQPFYRYSPSNRSQTIIDKQIELRKQDKGLSSQQGIQQQNLNTINEL